MVAIVNIDSNTFSINGIKYKKIFVAVPAGSDSIRIVSAYDGRFEVLPVTKFSDVTVDGVTSATQVELISSVIDIILNRISPSDVTGKLDKDGYEGTAKDLDQKIDSMATGIRGTLFIAGLPDGNGGFEAPTVDGNYNAGEAGTYTGLLDNTGAAIVVSAGELTNSQTILNKKGDVWTKTVYPFGFVAPTLPTPVAPSSTSSTTEPAGAKQTFDLVDNIINTPSFENAAAFVIDTGLGSVTDFPGGGTRTVINFTSLEVGKSVKSFSYYYQSSDQRTSYFQIFRKNSENNYTRIFSTPSIITTGSNRSVYFELDTPFEVTEADLYFGVAVQSAGSNTFGYINTGVDSFGGNMSSSVSTNIDETITTSSQPIDFLFVVNAYYVVDKVEKFINETTLSQVSSAIQKDINKYDFSAFSRSSLNSFANAYFPSLAISPIDGYISTFKADFTGDVTPTEGDDTTNRYVYLVTAYDLGVSSNGGRILNIASISEKVLANKAGLQNYELQTAIPIKENMRFGVFSSYGANDTSKALSRRVTSGTDQPFYGSFSAGISNINNKGTFIAPTRVQTFTPELIVDILPDIALSAKSINQKNGVVGIDENRQFPVNVFSGLNRLVGKKMLCLGTSFLQQWTSIDRGYIAQVGLKTGMTMINEGVSSSYIVDRGNLGLTRTVAAGGTASYETKMASLGDTNPPDFLYISHLVNDIGNYGSAVLAGDISSTDLTNLYGAYNFSIQHAYSLNPKVKIIIDTPPNIYTQEDSANRTRANMQAGSDIIKSICAYYNITFIDYGNDCGLNEINYKLYKADVNGQTGDFLHPSYELCELWSNYLAINLINRFG
ncbi:SGNH/GDSL hydrolase family protein [Leeuwenhoekiella nanhaiensis]|uniref:Uncharacterized protein n=1 Tax=Leeuwenhoekiella nanhaiensis TaxID=1655491 RepID=A0A2G1VMI6_9FLAO|nr:SGNH/GDSL hydrolase family protein [Leeuwenhoekiella nanhaiensis]PHQ27699.1 hypothetical protein CJ305_18710 [Leeuwenhoekiella nanhaiensis]